MADEQKARQFFEEVLKCFKIDSFKAVNSMDMLLIIQEEWYNYLMASKEFGFINNVENMDFFVCITILPESVLGITYYCMYNTIKIKSRLRKYIL